VHHSPLAAPSVPGQGLNLLRPETGLRKGFGKFYEAFLRPVLALASEQVRAGSKRPKAERALKGKTWIFYMSPIGKFMQKVQILA
jgi:hypothetical protein